MDEICLGNVFSRGDLFDETPAAGGAAIKSEGELLQIGLKVLIGHRALMGSKNPALQQTGNSTNAWHGDMRRIV